MKKLFFFAAAAVIGLIACNKSEIVEPDNRMKAPKIDYDEKLAAEYNADFDTVAFAVNRLLATNQNFRTIVKNEVGKQFDGDYDVLISQLIIKYADVEGLFKNAGVEIRKIVEKYPLIQIAIPIEFEKWGGTESLPIVYLPFGYQENKTPLNGYDKTGKLWKIDAQFEPDFSVVVISENERIFLADEEPDELSPLAPQNLVATTTASGIKLTWQKPISGTVNGYDINRKGVGEADYSVIYSNHGGNNLHYEDAYVQPELNYSYYVTAFYEEPDYLFSIIRRTPFVLRAGTRHNAPGDRHVSPPSNYVTANAPAFTTPTGIKLEHGNAGQLHLEWTSQPAFTSSYEIFGKSANDNDYSLYGTTSNNQNYFISNGLNAGVKYRYKVRSQNINGNYSAWSPSIGTFASERGEGNIFKINKVKFANVEALRKVEHWTRGAPELWLHVVQGDSVNSKQIKDVKYEPSSRKNSYEIWNNVSKIVIDSWDPNTLGTVLTFSWVEEDSQNKEDEEVSITTSFENKITDNFSTNTGVTISYKVGSGDDNMGFSHCAWWHAKSHEFEVYPNFCWTNN